MKRFLPVLLALAVLPASLPGRYAPAPLPAKNKGRLVMKTSMGTIKIELFPDKAPVTVKNFLAYVDAKHYDDTVFHRVIQGFMIQGGGYRNGFSAAASMAEVKQLEKATKAPIANEAKNGLSNVRGTIAMARTSDPNSATTQFFINVVDNRALDANQLSPGYCVFGKVVEGMDVVDKVRAVRTKALAAGFRDVPVQSVVIVSIRRSEK
jgi:cyclophilin family peptidyl-prolyl cis-trans isomerase